MLDAMVDNMIKTGVISGVAIDANPVWGQEGSLLIAKVWEASNKSEFIWTITGENAVTDHLPGSMALNPRDAARHFSYKWQMDAERLLADAKAKPQTPESQAVIEAHTNKIIQYAESLYELTCQDEIWKPR